MSRLSGFFDFARANARGADFDALAGSGNQGADRLEIWIPTAAPGIVGVADHVAEAWALAAVFTLHCHNSSYSTNWIRESSKYSKGGGGKGS